MPAPMAPPHFQGSVGGGKSCAQRTSLMLPKKPYLLPVGPPKDRLLAFSFKEYKREGRARRRRGLLCSSTRRLQNLQRPPKACTALQWPLGGLEPGGAFRASRTLQTPPGVPRPCSGSSTSEVAGGRGVGTAYAGRVGI